MTSRVGASSHARQLAEDECVRSGFDDGDDEARESVTDGHEGANECSVGAKIDATRSSAASEDAVDLHETFIANAFAHRSALGEGAKGGAYSSAVDERDGRARGLLLCAPANSPGAFSVEDGRGLEPVDHALEIA